MNIEVINRDEILNYANDYLVYLKSLGYMESTLTNDRRLYFRFSNYLSENSLNFSRDSVFCYVECLKIKCLNKNYLKYISHKLVALFEWCSKGEYIPLSVKKQDFNVPKCFEEIFDKYIESLSKNKESTIKIKKSILVVF